MATSVSEQIAAKVQARLQQIDTSDGYETTASQVHRPTHLNKTFQPKDYTIVIDETGETVTRVYAGNPPKLESLKQFDVRGILRQSEIDTTALDTLKNQFAADIRKSLTDVDSGDWRQWDGLAINTIFGNVEYAENETDSWLSFQFSVQYRTDENDPYTVRA